MISLRYTILIWTFLWVGTLSTSGQIPDEFFGYMDVFDLQMVDNPKISPDGKTIIYERHQFDVMTDKRIVNLWQISAKVNLIFLSLQEPKIIVMSLGLHKVINLHLHPIMRDLISFMSIG